MRGRLYPQPRQRYERFRLNPYSPLYKGLMVFVSAPSVERIRPELHGPYAQPGAAYVSRSSFSQFFPEIGRAAFKNSEEATSWPITLPSQKLITLTAMIRVSATIGSGEFVALKNMSGYTIAGLAEYNNATCPRYVWTNVGRKPGQGHSEGKVWPLNTWFTYSATFRSGSVSGYLSNWGIIDVTLLSGEWPTELLDAYRINVAPAGTPAFVSDTLVHLRELSLTELQAISDYSNVDLRVPGEAPLILPVRTYWPSVLPVAPSYLKRRSLGARSGTREAAL